MRMEKQGSSFNIFMKKEFKIIRASYPNLSHKEAFKKAADNWVRCRRIERGMEKINIS